jgi:hypothetical protein
VQCLGVRQDGGRCGAKVRQGSEFCRRHEGQASSGVMAGLVEAVGSGDRRRALEALRDRLAVEVERVADDGFCPACKRGSSSVAPLVNQLTRVLGELEELAPAVGGTALDELRRRREQRAVVGGGA